ncbi:MAG: glycosyltransferase [Ardenticatenaceae bacterium]|nr:glycosyltransferase [Ardenticatenaceae bacterium]MCB9444993.1 glycosyltransferase [Ardenticatenaceae bacterium]
MKKVNIVAWDNGGGLGRDISIIADSLSRSGYVVYFNGFKSRGHQARISRLGNYGLLTLQKKLVGFPFHVNIFLERVYSRFLGLASANFLVPNPEWMHEETVSNLGVIDRVLCKTKYTQKIYQEKGCGTAYIGFTSDDCMQAQIESKNEEDFIHIAGRNPYKGTKSLIDLWLKHPEWPTLVVVQSPTTYDGEEVVRTKANNINHILRYLSDDELRAMQNRYRIHLCPSEAEGFGHSIVEAMSCGGLVVTTNAPPMNELLTIERGVLVKYSKSEPKGYGLRFFVDLHSLEAVVSEIIDMPIQKKMGMGERARNWYQLNDNAFSNRLIKAIECSESRVPQPGKNSSYSVSL